MEKRVNAETKILSSGHMGPSHKMERLREWKGGDEFCYRSDVSSFGKRPSFSFICSVAYVAARRLCMGSAVGKPGSQESPLLPASLGFLANRTIGPEVHARHRMAAGLSARVLARMRQMETG